MTDLFERILFLKKTGIFSEVLTDDLRYIAQALEEDMFHAGERVFDINEQGDYLYIVTKGKIGISIDPDPSKQRFIVFIGPGEAFGEMNLIDHLPRSATAHVIEDTEVLTLEKSRLRGLLLSYPEISFGMMRALSLRIREGHARNVLIQKSKE
ncbi:MAG: cyclic nucleotide-binding domain-containing protein [Gammaproteobacteria bacterium]|nr:cyclic nucleotide-binding domain-containing protein [Gammaproteobacteria bacterium]